MTCQRATGVATAMQERFGDRLDVKILTVNSPEAAAYSLKGSTNVFVDGEWVPLDVATSPEKMPLYLEKLLTGKD